MSEHSPVAGRPIAMRMQHTTVIHSYEKRLRLFVLRAIQDPKQRALLKADYYLVDASEQFPMYCVWTDPRASGLKVDEVFEAGAAGERRYCFELPQIGRSR